MVYYGLIFFGKTIMRYLAFLVRERRFVLIKYIKINKVACIKKGGL